MAIKGHIDSADTLPETFQEPAWILLFTWLKTLDISQQAHGAEMDVPGVSGARAIVLRADTKNYRPDAPFEAHRREADIHYCIEGGEIIRRANTSQLELEAAYDPDKDILWLQSPSHYKISKAAMIPGELLMLGPSDAHLPLCHDGTNATIAKVVVKVPVAMLPEELRQA